MPGFDIVLVALLALAMPLAFDPSGLRPFVPPKQAVLLCGAALAALAAILRFVLAAWRGDASTSTRSDRWLVAAALAFCAWSLLAVTPVALNPALHLGFGWSCLCACLAVFFVAGRAAAMTGPQRSVDWLLGAVAIAALVMACHAMLQAADMDPLAWVVGGPIRESGRWRIFTTTGNPAWTAEFLAAAAPVTVWWVARFTRGAMLLWLLFAAAILPTGSRLGLAALLAGAALYAWARRRDGGAIRYPGAWTPIFLLCLVAFAASAWLLREHGYAAALLRWDDPGSVSGRLRLWQAALHLVASRPLAGHGLEHFALVLPDGLRAVVSTLAPLARSHMPNQLVDHAHNDFLEAAVETGIPGALLFLALFVAGLRAGWRALGTRTADGTPATARNRASPVAALVASLGVLGMLAVASAPLHTPATALLFWLVLGCLAGSTTTCPPKQHARSGRRWWLGGLVAACVVLAATVWSGQRATTLLAENRAAATAASLDAAGRTQAAKRAYASVLARAPWDHESRVALATLLIDNHRPDAALRVLDQADAWSQSREGWLARAQALVLEGDIRAALRVTERATAAVPDFLRAGRLQARLATRLGKTTEAQAAWHQILLSPQRSERAQRIMFEAAEALTVQAERPDPSP